MKGQSVEKIKDSEFDSLLLAKLLKEINKLEKRKKT